ncbi:MAG: thiol reductant ABC exporter subunit CydD [Rubrimonas sp.]|uniref:thiol reductant ABC exporter subunit CydD n=1 Tax=Rubrimonas sp. TaxID=2036015 RepID=UPI002FDE3156
MTDKKAPPASPMRAFEAAAAPALRRASALSVGAGLIWLAQSALIAAALAQMAGETGLAPAPAALGFVALAALRAWLGSQASRLGFHAALDVASQARAALARRAATSAPRDAGRALSGGLAALAADKLEAALPALARYQPARARAAVLPLAILLATAWVSWVAALILLIAGPLIPMFMALVGMAAKEASERQMVALGALSGLLLDRLRGVVDIRLMDATDRVADAFADQAEDLRARTMAVLRIAFLSSAVLELFSALGVALVAVYVGFSLLGLLNFGAWGGLALGEGVFVLMLAPAFFEPLRDFAAVWHDRAAHRAAAGEVDAALTAETLRLLGEGRRAPAAAGAPGIVLRDLAAGPATVSAEIAPGARVAVTGPSGSGKSTLLALIAGLEAPRAGEIEVAGRPLDDATADAWRARLAWVGQRPHFVAGSLRANVALAGDPADRAGVARALALAAASDVAARAEGGLDARLGETGHGVSGGEARRLAVARAAFAARDVILADEPTADLDADTARDVTEGLLRLAQGGATLIVATHDPALAARMDFEIRLGAAA